MPPRKGASSSAAAAAAAAGHDAAHGSPEEALLAALAAADHGTDGVPQSQLDEDAAVASFAPQARADALNRLMATGQVVMLSTKGGALLWKLGAPQDAKTKGLSSEELLILQIIRQAGNTGVWTRDMKVRTNLGQPQVTKILKTLEAKGLIKSVKNVNNPSRKLFMLAELEPSRDITGGAWYTDQQLDREFIEVLQSAVYKLITKQEDPHPSLADITRFINSRGLSRVELREDDIGTLVSTLLADGRIEEFSLPEEEDVVRYRVSVLQVPESSAFTAIPCGVCPVMEQCQPGGQISPATCVYFKAWLDA